MTKQGKNLQCSEGKVCFSCGYELNCRFVLPRSAPKSLTPASCPFHFMLALYSINLIISNLPDNLAMTMFLPETASDRSRILDLVQISSLNSLGPMIKSKVVIVKF